MQKEEKFVPYEKMSKKAQQEQNKRHRGSWGEILPTTRIVKSKKVYNRQRAKAEVRYDI